MKRNRPIYIHETPGRVRIRTEAIKKNDCAATAVPGLLQSVPGVLSAAANPLTGSITVTYDATRLHSAAILELLRAQGYIGMEPARCHRPVAPAQSSFAHTLGKIILNWTIDQAFSAALAALL
ncbi:MAG TPA: cation transporter [Bryobacteraceae bacterium]|jgi:copper chaperone CopZ|nr:cation transporter [Bryobacteraceae bacterium]